MTSIGKETEAVNAFLIKNSKGEGGGVGGGDGGKKREKKRGEGVGRKAVGRTGRSCMVYKIGLK